MTSALLALAVAGAEQFADGVRLRADAASARPHFAEAARLADAAWAGGDRTAATARMRVASHRLAGDIPRAVLAARQGLTVAPWDATLQRMLELCRDAVAYPTVAEPDGRMRPDPPAGIRFRFGPRARLFASLVAALLLGVGLAARLTARPRWGVPVLTSGLVGLLAMAILAWQIRGDDPPVAAVTAPTLLRAGNASVYPARVEAPVPRGAEVTPLGARGGWVQARLAGGAVGWLPEQVVLMTFPPSAAQR